MNIYHVLHMSDSIELFSFMHIGGTVLNWLSDTYLTGDGLGLSVCMYSSLCAGLQFGCHSDSEQWDKRQRKKFLLKTMKHILRL